MYRKLQKQIHPDKNKCVAKEATKIHHAMDSNDVVEALYSYYVYHDDCPIPSSQLDEVHETVRKEYIKYRKMFDQKPADIILRSPSSQWDSIFKQCVIK